MTPQTIAEEIYSFEQARAEAVRRGIENATDRAVSKEEAAAIELIVIYQAVNPFGHFDENEVAAATRLATTLAADPLLTKLLGAWHLEGMVFDWADNPNGVLGRAIDGAIEVLSTYRKDSE